jgi:phosphoenolpyruvate synthase/pyruvate phosphate dikinase
MKKIIVTGVTVLGLLSSLSANEYKEDILNSMSTMCFTYKSKIEKSLTKVSKSAKAEKYIQLDKDITEFYNLGSNIHLYCKDSNYQELLIKKEVYKLMLKYNDFKQNLKKNLSKLSM